MTLVKTYPNEVIKLAWKKGNGVAVYLPKEWNGKYVKLTLLSDQEQKEILTKIEDEIKFQESLIERQNRLSKIKRELLKERAKNKYKLEEVKKWILKKKQKNIF